ncbi:hypothetical protein QYF36_019542 [Acer negundo]|nr:hypothetical protein QYF36_019542 [Acer negundo]
MRKLLQKQILGSKKGNKGTPVTTLTEDKLKGLVYVNVEFEGWKAECLKILQSKFDSKTCTFAPDGEISEALQKSTVGQAANFKQTQKLCMPFLRFKKDEAIAIGPQDNQLCNFHEENQQRRIKNNILAFAKRCFSPEKVKILSAISDPDLQRQEFIKLWTLKSSSTSFYYGGGRSPMGRSTAQYSITFLCRNVIQSQVFNFKQYQEILL